MTFWPLRVSRRVTWRRWGGASTSHKSAISCRRPMHSLIDHVSGESDYPEIARCLEGAFGGEGDRIAVLRSLARNPRYRPELNVVARSADGRIASYCRGTVDADSGVGSIDPVATHPDFQGNGLGRAVVLACFAAQARLGGTEIYIGSGPKVRRGAVCIGSSILCRRSAIRSGRDRPLEIQVLVPSRVIDVRLHTLRFRQLR